MIKKILLYILINAPLCLAQNYRIDWYVIGSGGGHSQSYNYQIDGTIGQPIVGQSSSANYQVDAGFWVGFASPHGGCVYVVGDANNSATFNGLDVTYSVNYFKGGAAPPYSCECTPGNTWFVSGDVNNSCSFNGLDVTYMVNYFKGGAGPMPCADCPPAGIAVSAGSTLPTDAQIPIKPNITLSPSK